LGRKWISSKLTKPDRASKRTPASNDQCSFFLFKDRDNWEGLEIWEQLKFEKQGEEENNLEILESRDKNMDLKEFDLPVTSK
jgi:hypothetical protein